MGGVIFLANATIQLQPSFAASYTIITVCYCIGATLSPADHWNLTRLTFSDIRVGDERPLPGRIKRSYTKLHRSLVEAYCDRWDQDVRQEGVLGTQDSCMGGLIA
jgi:hypothetical protein